ncbi:MAG: hypothetical protein A3A73_02925 [Omnitrophica bacterium RIFCSPLOWO2_01_FULL_50_24]|nr:MAG: hypothetical protein A3A73_02925 [Omnitrophica bacterium RIFCSPLOWO2_01_FULL_50_24]
MLQVSRPKKVQSATPPVAKLVGFRLVKTGKGTAVCELRTRKEHENTIGLVHGGILCDLSDAAMGFAFLTLLPENRQGVTVEFKINFLKPAYRGDRLRAAAKALSSGKSISYLECEIRNSSGQLVAKAASTCKISQQFA